MDLRRLQPRGGRELLVRRDRNLRVVGPAGTSAHGCSVRLHFIGGIFKLASSTAEASKQS